MRTICFSLLIVLALSPPAIRAQLALNEGKTVVFGESVATVEQRLGEKAFDAERARPGIDRLIATTTAQLNFDSDRLWRITLKGDHLYSKPIRLFPAEWMNPTPIDGRSLAPWMPRTDFDAYLEAWRRRAEAAGKRENTDYWIKITESKSMGDRIVITLPPRRRVMGTGRLIGNSWQVQFVGATDARFNPKTPEGTLASTLIANEELSTLRRELPENRLPPRRTNGRPPAAAGVIGAIITLDDGRTVAFGQSPLELKWLLSTDGAPVVAETDRLERTKRIAAPPVFLDFDADRLCAISFGPEHTFAQPLKLFDEAWKNPDPIGDQKLKRGLTAAELHAYIEAWRQRALAAGKHEGRDFGIIFAATEASSSLAIVSLAPLRFGATGRNFSSDGFAALVAADVSQPNSSRLVVMARNDAFVATGRPAPGEPDPALAGVTLEDGAELYFGQPQAEIERIIGTAAKTGVDLNPAARANPSFMLGEVGLNFSGGRLSGIGFYESAATPAPFPEGWKNFTPIGAQRVAMGMTREQFTSYLVAWEKRAAESGLKRGANYFIRDLNTDLSEGLMITLPASGPSPSGLNRPDRWTVSFSPRGQGANRAMRLSSLHASRGEFNAAPPTPVEQRRMLAKELAQDVPVIAPPAPSFTLPKF